jgi:hypothetical protein
MKKVNLSAIISGILALFILSTLFQLIENHLFLLREVEIREAYGLKDSSEAGLLVIKSIDFQIYCFMFILLKYAIATSIVARSAKHAFLLNAIVFGIAGIYALTMITYLLNSEAIIDYPVLSILEVLWALFVCYLVGSLMAFRHRRANQAFN